MDQCRVLLTELWDVDALCVNLDGWCYGSTIPVGKTWVNVLAQAVDVQCQSHPCGESLSKMWYKKRLIVPFYKAQGEIIYTDGEDHDELHPAKATSKFVLQAEDVKEANSIVKAKLAEQEKRMREEHYGILKVCTVAAQPYPISEIVPRAFSDEYIKRDEQN